MERFIPFDKLSKKERRKQNHARRGDWGALNPVTRRSENPKAYKRSKARSWKKDAGSGLSLRLIYVVMLIFICKCYYVFQTHKTPGGHSRGLYVFTCPDSTSPTPASTRPGRCGR